MPAVCGGTILTRMSGAALGDASVEDLGDDLGEANGLVVVEDLGEDLGDALGVRRPPVSVGFGAAISRRLAMCVWAPQFCFLGGPRWSSISFLAHLHNVLHMKVACLFCNPNRKSLKGRIVLFVTLHCGAYCVLVCAPIPHALYRTAPVHTHGSYIDYKDCALPVHRPSMHTRTTSSPPSVE